MNDQDRAGSGPGLSMGTEPAAAFAGRAGAGPEEAEPRADALPSPQAADAAGYRSSHQTEGYGAHYDRTFQTGYYAALWRSVERPLLETVLRPLGGTDRTCLDFACGTGRIATVAATCFGSVVGADISASMLACVPRAPNMRLLNIDLTRERLGETFDVITAFRFFLNAEEHLRREVLRALHAHLDRNGRFVSNIHANASSPAGLAARLLNHVPGMTLRNTMGAPAYEELLREEGFSIERMIFYGYLPRPGSLLPKLCEALVAPTERACKAIGAPAGLAENFLVVARKR